MKEADRDGGGRSELQAAEERLHLPPGTFMPEHQSHLTPPALNSLGGDLLKRQLRSQGRTMASNHPISRLEEGD